MVDLVQFRLGVDGPRALSCVLPHELQGLGRMALAGASYVYSKAYLVSMCWVARRARFYDY